MIILSEKETHYILFAMLPEFTENADLTCQFVIYEDELRFTRKQARKRIETIDTMRGLNIQSTYPLNCE